MRALSDTPRGGRWRGGAGVVLMAIVVFAACAPVRRIEPGLTTLAQMDFAREVKNFGKTLGIEPTEALSRPGKGDSALSMLWLWLQRSGTLALKTPIDIRLAIGFNTERERLKIEQVYRVDGYSVYYRQGNEFADARSVVTLGFADEPLIRRVKVILHEDLHGDVNFALPWEIEEAIVTPLGSLAAAEYFRQKGDEKAWKSALASVAQEREWCRELLALAAEAERIFAALPVDEAKQKILDRLSDYPSYRAQFERQIRGQHGPTVLEAKLSHDLAYYRFFDRIAELAEKAPSLRVLIADLKTLPANADLAEAEKFLQRLSSRYLTAAE
jgi:hypothetical protein